MNLISDSISLLEKLSWPPISVALQRLFYMETELCTGRLLERAVLLVIDECSMGHRHLYETLDRSLKSLRDSEKTFWKDHCGISRGLETGTPCCVKG